MRVSAVRLDATRVLLKLHNLFVYIAVFVHWFCDEILLQRFAVPIQTPLL